MKKIILVSKGNSSIPVFKSHKSIEKKNFDCKPEPRITYQLLDENKGISWTPMCNNIHLHTLTNEQNTNYVKIEVYTRFKFLFLYYRYKKMWYEFKWDNSPAKTQFIKVNHNKS